MVTITSVGVGNRYLGFHFEGTRPEWCISNVIYIVEIHHSGWEPSISFCFLLFFFFVVVVLVWFVFSCFSFVSCR